MYAKEKRKEAGINKKKKAAMATTPLLLILFYGTILKRIRKE